MSDCGEVQSQRLVTLMLFVVERWDDHHGKWHGVKEFYVYHGSDVETVRQSVVAFMAENKQRSYGGKVIDSKFRATLIARESTVIDTVLEVIES